jgi:hypothetical protein
VKVFSIEFFLVLLALYIGWYMFDQNEKILSLENTLNLQSEAIAKQKFLIDLQHHIINNSQQFSAQYETIYQ